MLVFWLTQFFVSIDFFYFCLCYRFCFDLLCLFFYFSVPFCSSLWQERALLLFLRYASRWGNQTMRGFIKTGVTEPARHCAPHICPCQFIEEHLKYKPQGKLKYFRIGYWCSASEYYDWTSVCFLSLRVFCIKTLPFNWRTMPIDTVTNRVYIITLIKPLNKDRY